MSNRKMFWLLVLVLTLLCVLGCEKRPQDRPERTIAASAVPQYPQEAASVAGLSGGHGCGRGTILPAGAVWLKVPRRELLGNKVPPEELCSRALV